MPPKPLDFLQTAAPDATGVHNNIDDLIYQSDAENLWQKALNKVEQGMSGYKHPQPITGTAPDVALNPLLAAKKIPSLMKLLNKVKLRNPIYHHTTIPKAKEILKTGKIKPTSPFKSKDYDKLDYDKAFSITRDPMFLSRPHSKIGTDVRFIMDRDDLIRKGYKINPTAISGFKKTKKSPPFKPEPAGLGYHGTKRTIMNPRFEFEERVLGDLPTKDIKLIDWAKIPIGYGTEAVEELIERSPYLSGGARRPTRELQKLIEHMMGTHKIDVKKKWGWDWHRAPELPIIMSEQVRSILKKVQPYLTNVYKQYGHPEKVKSLEKLMSAPTYKYNPFKFDVHNPIWPGDPKVQLKKFKEYQKMVEKTNPPKKKYWLLGGLPEKGFKKAK